MTYSEGKEAARNSGILTEQFLEMYSVSWEDLVKIHDYLYKKAKRYGLIKEFKENGLL